MVKKKLTCPSCGEIGSLSNEGDRCVFCGISASQPKESNYLTTTVDQWREALDAAKQDDPGETVLEISRKIGLGVDTVRSRMTKLIMNGKCKAGTSQRQDSLGRMQCVTVYQLVEK